MVGLSNLRNRTLYGTLFKPVIDEKERSIHIYKTKAYIKSMDFSPLSIWLPLFLPAALLLLLLKNITVKRQKHLPPGPPKLPFISNLHQVSSLLHQSFWQLSNKYGPVMLLQLGVIPTLVISSADAAKQLLKDHDLDCCTRPQSAGTTKFFYNNSDVAYSPYGPYWREIRKICVLELFSVKRVQSFKFVREEEVALLIDTISQSATLSTAVEITEKFYDLTGNIIFRIAFGKRRNSAFASDHFQRLIHKIENMLASFNASEFFPRVGWIYDKLTDRNGNIEKVFQEINDFFEEVIHEHLNLERIRGEEDITDVLLKIESDQAHLAGAANFSKDNIKAILLNIFLGGVDTGSITMEWAMAELARNPRVMKKVQNEIRRKIGKKGKVNEEDIEKLDYLKMVIKETMRLHPAAPLTLPRESIREFNINGYKIYPKTLIHVNAWGIGRNPKHWTNPLEFYPERFEDSCIDYKGQNFELLPFGSGRRGCPGIYMAITTIELALANLLYCFDWKLPNGMKEQDIDLEETAGFSLTINKKIALNLVPVNYL